MADLFLIPYVRSIWQLLSHRLGRTGRMCLFGGGAHTRWLLSTIADLPSSFLECVIDENPTDRFIQNIPLYRPAEVNIDTIDLMLISSDRWEDELADRCRVLWGDRVEIMRLYEGLPPGPYDKTDDRTEALRRIGAISAARPVRSQQVVMVSDRPGSREAKIGYALKHAGWQPILFHRKTPSFDATSYFDKVRCYNHEWEALRAACDYSPVAYHIMVNSDYRLAELFVRHRPGVIVVDPYDCIAGMYTNAFMAAHPDFSQQIDLERYCLQQADGICCRSREAEWLEERFGYTYRDRLLFPDGCWNRSTLTKRSPDGELHTVYAGHIDRMYEGRKAFTAHGSKLWLAQTLADQRIHFHLYPWCTATGEEFESAFREYRELEKITNYFHLHRPLPPDQLIEELGRYDLAMFVYNEFVEPGTIVHNFTPDKLRVAASNKVFDFVDAYLPVAHTAVEGSFICDLLDRHQIRVDVLDISPHDWGDRFRNLDFDSYRDRIVQARADYDIRRHIHKLTDFYLALRTGGPQPLTKRVKQKEEYPHADSRSEHRQALV